MAGGGEGKSGSGSGLKPVGGGGMGRLGGHSSLIRFRPRQCTSRGDGDTQPMQGCDGECGRPVATDVEEE
jgi:hypothetical protein